jgi:hypothetical protein
MVVMEMSIEVVMKPLLSAGQQQNQLLHITIIINLNCLIMVQYHQNFLLIIVLTFNHLRELLIATLINHSGGDFDTFAASGANEPFYPFGNESNSSLVPGGNSGNNRTPQSTQSKSNKPTPSSANKQSSAAKSVFGSVSGVSSVDWADWADWAELIGGVMRDQIPSIIFHSTNEHRFDFRDIVTDMMLKNVLVNYDFRHSIIH